MPVSAPLSSSTGRTVRLCSSVRRAMSSASSSIATPALTRRTLEGEPALDRIAVLDDGAPEDQDVDARVVAPRRSIPGDAERCAYARRAPRLHPGQAAGLQLGDDLAGDVVVERAAILGRARVGGDLRS